MPAEIPRRVLGYARVSTAEQAFGQSLQEQQAALSAYAKTRGLSVVRFFVEAESGGREKLEHREQMRLILREVRHGDLVVVDKLDRWSRDPEFTYRSVREILEAGASMFFVAEGIDPTTRDGDTHLNFRILFAREEHKRIRERTHGVRASLRRQGYHVEGTWPFGYRKSDTKGPRDLTRHILEIAPDEAKTVREMFRLAARGEPLQDIAVKVGMGRQRVLRIIHNRAYLGEMRPQRKGEWVKGRHDPIVTASLFERANSVVTSRMSGARRSKEDSLTKDWLIKKIARCALCGGAMISAYSKPKPYKGRVYGHFYYLCYARCGARYVPVSQAETAILALVEKQLVTLKDQLAKGPEPVATSNVDFGGKRAALERRRARHIEAHASDIITLGDLRAAIAKVDIERQKLDVAESATGTRQRANEPAVRRAMLRDVKRLEERWRNALPPTKREIINQLAKQIRIARDVVEPDWRTVDELSEDLGR